MSSIVMDASLWCCSLGRDLIHEIIVGNLIPDRTRVKHAQCVHCLLTLLVTLEQHLQRAEGLSLVTHLVYQAIQSRQVGLLFDVCKYFFLCDQHAYLSELTHFKECCD